MSNESRKGGAAVSKERADTITIGDTVQFTSMEFAISINVSVMDFVEADDQTEDTTVFIPSFGIEDWLPIDFAGKGLRYWALVPL